MSEIKKIYIEPTMLEKYFLKDGEKIIKKDGEYYVKKINNQKVFSLEYDKATLTDMVCELQEKYESLLTDYRLSIEKRVELEQRIDKAIEYIDNTDNDMSYDNNGHHYNIINELEDLIVIKLQRDYHEHNYRINTGDLEEIYDKLQELKGSDKE